LVAARPEPKPIRVEWLEEIALECVVQIGDLGSRFYKIVWRGRRRVDFHMISTAVEMCTSSGIAPKGSQEHDSVGKYSPAHGTAG
jgi:hypothetical protein